MGEDSYLFLHHSSVEQGLAYFFCKGPDSILGFWAHSQLQLLSSAFVGGKQPQTI